MNLTQTELLFLNERRTRLKNAITDAVSDMVAHPDDDVKDIWNEHLAKWHTGVHMTQGYAIEEGYQP